MQALLFTACVTPPLRQQFNLTSVQSGQLRPLLNQTLCSAPPRCATAPGTLLSAAPCAPLAACSSWTYDTFTYFTLTHDATGLLLTAQGEGAAALINTADGSPSQQFIWSQQDFTLQPASDPTLCLTAAAPGAL